VTLKTCICRGFGAQKKLSRPTVLIGLCWFLVILYNAPILKFSQAIFAISVLNPNYDVINDVISGFAKVLPNTYRTQAAKSTENAVFIPCGLDLWPLTLTFKLFRARDQTRLACEFGANPFSGSRDIHTQTKVIDSAKNRTLRSSLRAIIMTIIMPSPQHCWLRACRTFEARSSRLPGC